MTVRLAAAAGAGAPAVDSERLARRAGALLRAVGHPDSELSVRLAGDAEIAELNERFRGRVGPTDVLSFSLIEGEHARHRGSMLGDVVIGLGVAERQACELGLSLDEELDRLLIHGVLHLLGHDHEEAGEAQRMRREEERLRKVLGE